jgi:hypothetical protein
MVFGRFNGMKNSHSRPHFKQCKICCGNSEIIKREVLQQTFRNVIVYETPKLMVPYKIFYVNAKNYFSGRIIHKDQSLTAF